MNGVLSLAVSLPYVLPDARMLPHRSIAIYLAFCLIVATLVVFGLTLTGMIRRLGLLEPVRMEADEQKAQCVLLREAPVHLDWKQSTNRDQSATLGELIVQRLDAMPDE
jgi:NhaP-type Na+/H+ or K+/H+ antiporter